MSLTTNFPTTVNALRPHQTTLESTKNKKMGWYTSFDLERFSIGVRTRHTAFFEWGYNHTFRTSQNSQKSGQNKYTSFTQYAILTNMQENTEAHKLELIIDLIQTERRYLNNILADVCTMPEGVEPLFVDNPEDLVRAVGNMNAAYEHAKSMQTLDDPNDYKTGLFCLMKHLATALVQIEEVGLSTRMIYKIIKEVSGGRIKACGACEDDSAKLGNSDSDDYGQIIEQLENINEAVGEE